MGLGLSQTQRLGQETRLEQRQSLRLQQAVAKMVYSSIGELELFSLHRIRHRIGTLEIKPKIQKAFSGYLIEANMEYRRETDRDWNCITPDSLDSAVDKTKALFVRGTNSALEFPQYEGRREILRSAWMDGIDKDDQKIRDWVVRNYDDLIYDQSGKIPWAVVQRLRRSLEVWAIEKTNPFGQPVIEIIDEVAPTLGIDVQSYTSYEDIWNEMRDRKKE